MAQNPLATVLTAPSGAIPLYLRRFEIAVDYAAPEPELDKETLEDAVEEMEGALKLGFFAWGHFAQREAASLSLDWTGDRGFVLRGTAEGIHHNVLVALLRLIVNLHHTPLEAYEEARAALGDDGNALPQPMNFAETVGSIRISGLEGAGGRLSARQDFDAYIADDEIGPLSSTLFADVGTTLDGERIVITASDGDAFEEADFDEIEEVFLQLCGSGCFSGLDTIEELAEEPELFLREEDDEDDDEAELVIDDYAYEAYGLLELLNCLSMGNIALVTVSGEH